MAKKGKEKASVATAIMRMIRARLIMAIFLTFAFSAFAILGPVSRGKEKVVIVGPQIHHSVKVLEIW